MKGIKLLLLLTCFLCVSGKQDCYAFSIHEPLLKTRYNEALKYLRADEFVKLSAKQFSSITGRHMNVWNKLAFGILKASIKHELKKNPNLRLTDYYTSKKKSSAFNVLRLVLIVIGVLLLTLLIIAGIGSKK